MSAGVLLAVLLGALLHASWNLLVKARQDTHFAAAGVYIGAGALSCLALPLLPAPAPASWPYLAASTAVEVLYGVLLAAAYRVGDLSHAYPLMRGTAPLLVALGSGVLIGEPLSAAACGGVALVSAGVLSMILDARTRTASSAATRLALLNACVIAAYTTIDGLGVRLSRAPVAYSLWLSLLVGLPWLAWVAARRSFRLRDVRAQLPVIAFGGACSVGSYTLALWAMTRAPVAAVAAVRETAIVFGAALGALVLRERVTWVRGVAAVAIAFGVWVIRAS
ncbi:MAG TPA: DMT family transporter [Steroidobacteraceae bacterium]|nr:DMT family transporter [Steroidobacteraceae bacterium]